MDVLSLALSKKFTEETVVGGGAIKGKNCTIQSIEPVDGGNNVTFQWTLDDGTVQSQTMFVANGTVGPQGPQGPEGPVGPEGPQGEKGADGVMTFADLTEEQKASLKGEKGDPGEQGPAGDPGTAGADGITPHIGENGNWFIGETDTGVKAGGSGESGGGAGVVVDSIPVGSIVSQMGNTSPKHYLVCDGAEYNIADYPYLAEYFEEQFNMVNIFGGDGITTFAVPKEDTENLKIIASLSAMTSNTAPSPLVASASSTYSDAYPAWKAFDKSAAENSLDAWLSATNTMPQWIMIDCGKPFTCNSVYLAPWNYQSNYETSGPKDFIIQGSNDGESFDDLLSVTDAAWTGNEVEYCTFDIVTYRYYRLYITKILSANWASVTRFDPMLSTPVKRYIKYEPCL